MLLDLRVVVAISNTALTSIIFAALNTTLPVHLRNIFSWGPLDVSTIFLIFRVPGIVLRPIAGWLRDHVSLRYPTTIGWMIMCPLLIFYFADAGWGFLFQLPRLLWRRSESDSLIWSVLSRSSQPGPVSAQ
jgi:Na+/melibiose symporter-like transporter